MKPSTLLRRAVALALVGAAACEAPTASTTLIPTAPAGARASSTPAITDENVSVSPLLQQVNASLASRGANVQVAKAELLYDTKTWDGQSSTVILANDRSRGIGTEWVKGDPRRGSRLGVTYAVGSNTSIAPVTLDGSGAFVDVTPAQQLAEIEQAVGSWRSQTCSAKPITSVPVPVGTDPDYLDQFFRGNAAGSVNYFQPADIVESGWQPGSFFRAIAGGPAGNSILGITFSFIFVDNAGNPTDIDRNGKDDTALAEIYFNARYVWGDNTSNLVDFYSIIAHETGHSLGLGHFGKLFVTAKDAADGISAADVKFAPYALMNAGYVGGQNSIQGTDNSQFCQIWASR
jgi:hypothetical protein